MDLPLSIQRRLLTVMSIGSFISFPSFIYRMLASNFQRYTYVDAIQTFFSSLNAAYETRKAADETNTGATTGRKYLIQSCSMVRYEFVQIIEGNAAAAITELLETTGYRKGRLSAGHTLMGLFTSP